MSVAESFLSAGKQFLLATENLKRLDEKVSRLTDDITSMNMRLVRVETLLSMESQSTQNPRPRRTRTLPGTSE
jgi:hypothetical protein